MKILQLIASFTHYLLPLSGLIILLAFIGGPGAKLGLWSALQGFTMTIRWGMLYGGGALIVLSLVSFVAIYLSKDYSFKPAIMALVAGVILFTPVLMLKNKANSPDIPMIHDITTDITNPPQFETVVSKREADANSLNYEGEAVSSLQLKAYPTIKPLTLPVSQADAMKKAEAVIEHFGWKLDSIDEIRGRIEATDYTPWFNFADDVVVVISAQGDQSVINVRSVSRYGMSDLGLNAKRIDAFLQLMQGEIPSED